VEYLEELDSPEGFDELEEWSDDIDMFIEGLSNPHKLKELWEQSKVKKLWDNFQVIRQHPEKNNP